MTISHADALVNGNEEETYTLTVTSGSVRDVALNEVDVVTVAFTVKDKSIPVLEVASSTPSSAQVLAFNSNLQLVFNEPVKIASGVTTGAVVTLTPGTSGSTVTITGDSSELTIQGSTITIDPSVELDNSGQAFTLAVASGTIVDDSTSENAMSAAEIVFSVSDQRAPTLTGQDPTVGATGVALTGTTITLTFSEDLASPATGEVLLVPSTTSSIFTVAASTLSVSGSIVSFPVTLDSAQEEQEYAVRMGSDALKDSDGNAFAGFAGSSYVWLGGELVKVSVGMVVAVVEVVLFVCLVED